MQLTEFWISGRLLNLLIFAVKKATTPKKMGSNVEFCQTPVGALVCRTTLCDLAKCLLIIIEISVTHKPTETYNANQLKSIWANKKKWGRKSYLKIQRSTRKKIPEIFLEKKSDFWGPFSAKNGRFLAISGGRTKIYFNHFFKSGQNIMSLLQRNIQIIPPSLTD